MKSGALAVLVIVLVTALATTLIWDWPTGRGKVLLGLDLRSGSHILVQLVEAPNPVTKEPIKIDEDVVRRSMQVFQRRLNPDGNREIVLASEPPDRLIIEIPELTDLRLAEDLVRRVGRLEFCEQRYDPQRRAETWETLMDGSMITWAAAAPAANRDMWEVHFETTREGGELMANFTRRLVGKPLGIFFDGKMVSLCTVLRASVGTNGGITGLEGGPDELTGKHLTALEQATQLADFLNAGALPVEAKILEGYTVSPTLGAESLRSSLIAGLVGLTLVCLYMVAYYRLPGVAASLALIIYSVLTLASMCIPTLQFVLTLAGITGFILSIGMAVDANVLIFERIKEELWAGENLDEAVSIGFDRAWSSILDGHVTTGLGAGVLYWLGTASLKGFGLTLLIGTAWSLVTATVVTRKFLGFAMVDLKLRNPDWYGASGAPSDEEPVRAESPPGVPAIQIEAQGLGRGSSATEWLPPKPE